MRVERTTAEIKRRGTLPSVIVTLILGLLVAFAFPLLPAHAYRTTADLEDFEGHAARWERAPRIQTPDDLELARALGESIVLWSSAMNAAMNGTSSQRSCGDFLEPAENHAEPTLTVAFLAPWPHGSDELGSTRMIYERIELGGEVRFVITGAHIELNQALIDAQNVPLTLVVAHEFGHALGLLHPCDGGQDPGAHACGAGETSSLMHPIYQMLTTQLALDEDDVAGLCELAPRSTTEPGAGQLGDACVRNDECTSAHCGERGVCVAPCRAGECDGRASCSRAGLCEPSGGAFGDPCNAGADCATGLCVTPAPDGVDANGHCTRVCGAACPEGSECQLVDNEAVCRLEEAKGCNASSRPPGWFALLLFFAVITRRGTNSCCRPQ